MGESLSWALGPGWVSWNSWFNWIRGQCDCLFYLISSSLLFFFFFLCGVRILLFGVDFYLCLRVSILFLGRTRSSGNYNEYLWRLILTFFYIFQDERTYGDHLGRRSGQTLLYYLNILKNFYIKKYFLNSKIHLFLKKKLRK